MTIDALVDQKIADAVATIPKGDPGEPGAQGEPGPAGPPGKDGAGTKFPSWLTGHGLSFLSAVQEMIDRFRGLPKSSGAKVASGATVPAVTNIYGCGVNMADGRIYFVPHSHTAARVFDPETKTVVTPVGTFPSGASMYNGGNLLSTGEVFCAPSNATKAKIFDPATESLFEPAPTFPGNYAFNGSATLPNGMDTILCPHNHNRAWIYHRNTDTVTVLPEVFPGNYAYSGVVPLFNGEYLFVPHMATAFKLYNPVTGTFRTLACSAAGGEAFVDAVPLNENEVYLAPHKSPYAYILNITTETLTQCGGAMPAGGLSNYRGAFLMPDGRIFLVPFKATKAKIYDPATNMHTEPPGTYAGNGEISHGVLTTKGFGVLIPFNGTSIYLVATGYGAEVDPQVITSPLFNGF